MEIDDETAELNKINAEVNAMIIKATSKQRKKKKKKAASILSYTSTVSVSVPTISSSFTANNNEQDIDMIEDAGCIEVSNAIAAAANAATVAAIESHGLKNNNKKISDTGDNDDSSVDSSSSDSVIDLDALGRSATTTIITGSGCNINSINYK